jgi:hypothetical protein
MVMSSPLLAYAQSTDGIEWEDYVVLSGPVSLPVPRLVVDGTGTLHLFFHVFSRNQSVDQQVIYHRALRNGSWTPLNDILFVGEGQASISISDAVFFPPTHEIFIGGDSSKGPYIAWAPATGADSAANWQVDWVEMGVGTACMDVSQDGRAYLVYSTADGALQVISKSLESNHWTSPVILWQGNAQESAPGRCDALVDSRGHLHVSWDENFAKANWTPLSIWYGRLDPGRSQPSIVEEAWQGDIGETVSHSHLQAGPNEEIVHLWNRGVTSPDGRYYRLSNDYGDTWTDPRLVAEEVSGFTGYSEFAWDSLGNWYFITAGNVKGSGSMELRYSRRVDGNWLPSVKLDRCEELDTVVVDGNRLYIACGFIRQGYREAGLYEGHLPAPHRPTPTLPPLNPTSTPTPDRLSMEEAPTVTPISTRAIAIPTTDAAAPVDAMALGGSLRSFLWGALAAGGLVIVVVVARLIKNRRSQFG